jgi:hypothetical protein
MGQAMRIHLSLLLLASACTDDPFNGNGATDAAIHGDDGDASTGEPDAGTGDAMDSGSEPEHDAAPPGKQRCEGGDFETAPSGAACDPTRIEGGGLLDCYGPPKGQHCDEIVVDIAYGAETPAGVQCTHNGSAPPICRYVGDQDGGSSAGDLDDATLEALCALTESDPELVVRCSVYE